MLACHGKAMCHLATSEQDPTVFFDRPPAPAAGGKEMFDQEGIKEIEWR